MREDFQQQQQKFDTIQMKGNEVKTDLNKHFEDFSKKMQVQVV